MEERKTFIEKYTEERDEKTVFDKIPMALITGIIALMYFLQVIYVVLCIYFVAVAFGPGGLIAGFFIAPLALVLCPFLEIAKWHSCIILTIGLILLVYWLSAFLITKYITKEQ